MKNVITAVAKASKEVERMIKEASLKIAGGIRL